ncbi:N-acetylglucosaminyl-phosphatidylinositol de-N-acetylase [[Candida] anglica]|uniref:N-acetylglucosaminylphosphatidylinositol deacetylase n=1 Tax=[Candida] anglica TaxID=148631 RepID=A0ABP0EDB3_9ASCO
MFNRVFAWLVRFFVSSFLVWIVLTTVIPQTVTKYTHPDVQVGQFHKSWYPYRSLVGDPSPLTNSTVLFVVAHPDDEVMFFSPSVIEASKPQNGNLVRLLCLSNGDASDVSMGTIRAAELKSAARILGIHTNDVEVLEDGQFKDGMSESWDIDQVADTIEQAVSSAITTTMAKSPSVTTVRAAREQIVVVTFDSQGVSNHPNHISLHHGAVQWYKKYQRSQVDTKRPRGTSLLFLRSLSFFEKYSFTLVTNCELFAEHVSRLVLGNIFKLNVNIAFFSRASASSPVTFYSDLNMLSVAYAAMAYGHFSQMVWFRYGWLIFSRYLTFNQLVPVE